MSATGKAIPTHRFDSGLSAIFKDPLPGGMPALRHCSVYSRGEQPCREYVEASRRDFYKISLITRGAGVLTFGNRRYEVQAPALLFINPIEVKEWQATSEEQDGYYCLFTEAFFPSPQELKQLRTSPFFQLGANPVVPLDEQLLSQISYLLRCMLHEYRGQQPDRSDMMRHYLSLLMLSAKRASGVIAVQAKASAAQQLSIRFLRLLEQQFPIEDISQQMELRKPVQFAEALHVNEHYLNQALKEITGLTVSQHIQNRVTTEALLLLHHSGCPVNRIAWSLGFEDTAYFSNFIRKRLGVSPRQLRQTAL